MTVKKTVYTAPSPQYNKARQLPRRAQRPVQRLLFFLIPSDPATRLRPGCRIANKGVNVP